MIRGRGLLANALSCIDSDKYLFYVNGISNSVMDRIPEDNFEAGEIMEISKIMDNKIFVYFSTSQVNLKVNYSRPYVQHKYKMECLIKKVFSNYTIVRTSNLVGHNPWNKHTLFNFLYNSLKAGTEIHIVESAKRNVLDVDHFIELLNYYLNHFPQKNTTIDIVNPISYKMGEIITEFELVFSKAFIRSHLEETIAYFKAPAHLSLSLVNNCNVNLDDYLARILRKYYTPIVIKANYC